MKKAKQKKLDIVKMPDGNRVELRQGKRGKWCWRFVECKSLSSGFVFEKRAEAVKDVRNYVEEGAPD